MENYKYLKYKNKYEQLKKTSNMAGGSNNKLYLFKSETCGHCIRFKETWENLQSNNKYKIEYQTFDSKKNQDKMKDFKIDGYPTIMLISNNKAIEYTGERTQENIENFISKYIN